MFLQRTIARIAIRRLTQKSATGASRPRSPISAARWTAGFRSLHRLVGTYAGQPIKGTQETGTVLCRYHPPWEGLNHVAISDAEVSLGELTRKPRDKEGQMSAVARPQAMPSERRGVAEFVITRFFGRDLAAESASSAKNPMGT